MGLIADGTWFRPATIADSASKRRMAPIQYTMREGNRAVNIYFVARSDESTHSRVTQGVVARDRWVALKKELAADGFVVTYWCSLEDDVLEDVAA
jgi:hypothetical protein